LALDTSAESKARQLELQDELNKKLEDLARKQRDHSYEEQERALDDEYGLYEKHIDKQKEVIQKQYDALQFQYDLVQEQIDLISEFLSKSGLIAQEAMSRMGEKAPDLYEKLIEWNSIYGTGIKKDVVDAWEEAYQALKKYGNLVDALRGEEGGAGGGGGSRLNWKRRIGLEVGHPLWEEAVKLGKAKFLAKYPEYKSKLSTHHSGLASGPVGDYRTPVNEVFAKLMRGEMVMNQADMLGVLARIPNIAENMKSITTSSDNVSLTIGKLISVEGNVDKDVLPDIKKVTGEVMREINKALIKRGHVRGAQLFST